MRRVRLRFAKDLEIEFRDRDRALQQIEQLAERGTLFPVVIYGPEGCGKTAFFKQVRAVLEERGYHVIYASPLAESVEEILSYTPTVKGIVKEVLKAFPEPYSRIVDAAIRIVSEVMKRLRRSRIALLLDDVFQAVGLDKAETYVKILLNLIEYPPGDYENIVVMASSSEGVTRDRIGRHGWASMRILWNMCREGFEQLHDAVPDESKPSYETVWRITGGNPRLLKKLYEAGWDVNTVFKSVVEEKKLDLFVSKLSEEELEILRQVIEDPDNLVKRLRERSAQELERKLIELNLIMYMHDRDEHGWIDQPPPEKDLELGIGRFYAWQTPIHREAMKKALRCIEVTKH